MAATAIEIAGLNVKFGGVTALSDISLTIPEGRCSGIIGPNGAGKTTLFNCVSGFVRPIKGATMTMGGEDLLRLRVDQVARLGVARTFQNISLNRAASVRENILTGLHVLLPYGALGALCPLPYVWRAEREAARRIDEVADKLGLARSVLDQRVDTLSLGLQKKVEVARAIVRNPTILMLDEPAGGLNDAETTELLNCLLNLKRQPGLSILLIDHDMSLVMPLCDRVFVLDFGCLISQGTPAQVAKDPAVIASYLGESE